MTQSRPDSTSGPEGGTGRYTQFARLTEFKREALAKVTLKYHSLFWRPAMLPALKPVTEIKRHATEIIDQLRADRVPVLITEHGKEAAVMLDVATYKGMLHRLELLEVIAKGEQAFTEGRASNHADVKARMAKRWA